jgi:hypothetical protein
MTGTFMSNLRNPACLLMVVLTCWPGSAAAADVGRLLTRIKAVGKEGAGNSDAAQAWKELVRGGPEVLSQILTAIDDARPAAANWLRSAVDAIAESALSAGKPLPLAKLEDFVRERRHAGAGRRLAYEWLVRVDSTAPDRLLPGMLDDPGAELRRDAVEMALKKAQGIFDKEDKAAARTAYQKLLEAARDRDQVLLITQRLKKLGVDIDTTAHFGFITRWRIAGLFDSSGGAGFQTVFPPEKGVDPAAVYKGKDQQEVRWKDHTTTLPMGVVDLNKVIAPMHGTAAIAWTTVLSPSDQPVELRAASGNAIRIYLNGKEIFFWEEYHHGKRMDQHVARGVLKAGTNEILVKVCQNEQTEDWAQDWSFQLRVCDALGGRVPVTVIDKK